MIKLLVKDEIVHLILIRSQNIISNQIKVDVFSTHRVILSELVYGFIST